MEQKVIKYQNFKESLSKEYKLTKEKIIFYIEKMNYKNIFVMMNKNNIYLINTLIRKIINSIRAHYSLFQDRMTLYQYCKLVASEKNKKG